MAQAVLLTPKEVANYYKQQELLANPDIRKLATLDQEISTILSRTDLPSTEKLRLYESVLLGFNAVKKNILEPSMRNDMILDELPLPPPPPLPAEVEVAAESDVDAKPETIQELHEIQNLLNRILKQRGARGVKTSTIPTRGKMTKSKSTTRRAGPSRPSKTSSSSPMMSFQGNRLKTLLFENALFRDLVEKNKKLKGVPIDEHLLDQALTAMTNPTLSGGVGKIPENIRTLSSEIYKFMDESKIAYPKSYLSFPLIKSIKTATLAVPTDTTGRGCVDFESWDKHQKI